MNKEKLRELADDLMAKPELTEEKVSTGVLVRVIEAILEEPEHVPYGHPLFRKHIKKQIHG